MRSRMVNIALDLSSTLPQSKSSFLAAHLLPSGKPYASLVVGATITQGFTDKILLLKRSPAEKLFPHHWEIPGGKVDDTDKTIWDALKREVHEETGLSIQKSNVLYGEMGFEWALGEDIEESDITKAEMGFGWGLDEGVKNDAEMALELNFMVGIEELLEEVKLDPEEHLESLWADETDIVGLEMTPEMRCVVEDALACLQLRTKSPGLMGIFVTGLVIAIGISLSAWVGLLGD